MIIINQGLSQGETDIHKILNTAFINSSVIFKSEKMIQLENLDYKLPMVEKIEIRSETNDFDLRKQDIGIRVSPNAGTSRKAYRLYHESVRYMSDMEHKNEVMKSLYERYQLIKDYVFTKEMLRLEKVKNTVALDKVKLLKKMILLSSFDIVELIEAEDELNKLQRKIQSLKNQEKSITAQLLKLLASQEIEITLADLVSVQQIKELILLNEIRSNKYHPEEEVLSAKHYNSLLEYEWEESQNKFSIGFIQAKYGYNPNESFGNNFTLGFGFDFPIKGSTRLDLNGMKINILDSKSDYLTLREQLDHEKIVSESRLYSLISTYELLSKQIKEGNANHALIEYSKQRAASPRALLKLKELTVSNEVLLIELQAEITEIYLNFIQSTGVMGKLPYRNYFDENISIIQQ